MRKIRLFVLGTLFASSQVNAEWTFIPSIDSGVITQDAKIGDENKIKIDTINIDPSLSVNYESRLVNAKWLMRHQHLIRETSDDNFKDDFSTYQYEADIELIENLLSVEASGDLSLRNLTPGDYLTSDRFLNPEALTKTRVNNVGLNLDAERLDWVNIESEISFSDLEAEEQSFDANNLNGTTYTWSAEFTEGDNLENVLYVLNTLYSKSENTGNRTNGASRRSDQISREIQGFLNYQIFNNIGVVVRGSNEGYRFDDVASIASRRDFTSYGAGLSYLQSANRVLTLTYNRGERDDEKEYYLGGAIRWAFSGRTSLEASLGKRYYGDSGSFQFNYATRNLRASVNYSERVTNFSRLTANSESLGVFVCPSNDINISSCYQPNSLNVQLEPGEQFTEFSDFVVEVSDEPILIKSSTAILGYAKTRFSMALEFRYSNPFYESTGREQLSYTTVLSGNYELGPKTDFRAQLTYIEAAERPGTSGLGARYDDTIYRALGAVSYRVNSNLLADFEIRFVDRDSDIIERNVKDRRLSVTLKYTF